MVKVWLADYAEVKWWRRFWPERCVVGQTAAGDEVWLLKVPFAPEDEQVVRWLARCVGRLLQREKKHGVVARLGLPLVLAELLAAEQPEVLAAGRRLACREFAARLVSKLPDEMEVGVWGVCEAWQGELVRQLLAAGVRVAVAGPLAARLAAECWRGGVALPVISGRKLLEVCDVVVAMPGAENRQLPNERVGQRVVAFGEGMVWVPGRFGGEFAFNMFPCGMAAALKHCD